ncbi:MAG TPA: glycosyltransferase family 2 protein [Solirubrobacteraceae bacterium]|jgi:GT2 family glycosyltransferase|nr:glycosyltransferase family 2 protein [Solirubrobacteraceae bacterium]
MSAEAVDMSASHLPAEEAPELTITIPNYNGRALLEVMLPSLQRQTFRSFTVVIVDDCSADDSVAYLKAQWPQVRVVEGAEQRGVSTALNTCLAEADSELVGLFNNDMELDPSCLAELVGELRRHPEIGSVTPKMLDFTDRTVLDGAGDLLDWRGGGGRRGHGDPDVGQYAAAEEIFGPCGGAAVYRSSALDLVGGFDDDYFAYYEDLDWAFRAQLAGVRCRYVPSAVLYHRGGATLGRGMTDFIGYHTWRNPIWLIVKCFPAATLARHAPALLHGQLGNLAAAARAHKLRVWARAMRDALGGLPAALRKRRAVQRTRTVSLAQLEQVARAGRR